MTDYFTIQSFKQKLLSFGTNYGYSIELGNGKKYENLNKSYIDTIKTLSEYSTEDSPNITPDELWEATEEIYQNTSDRTEKKANNGYGRSENCVMLDNYDTLTKHYTDKNSPAGEDITPDELYNMVDTLIDWKE